MGLSATPSPSSTGTTNTSTTGTVALGGVCTKKSDCAGYGDTICCGEYDISAYQPSNRFSNVNTTSTTTTSTVYTCVGDSYLSTLNAASTINSSYYITYDRTCSNAFLVSVASALSTFALFSLF
jgi:hypothetical protein